MKVLLLIAFVAIFASQVLSQDCVLPRCTLPVKPGDCSESLPRWYFDNDLKKCRVFVYTGCGGNVNRFETKKLCEDSCFIDCTTSTTPATTTRKTTQAPTSTTTRRTTQAPTSTTTRRPTQAPTTVSPLPPRCNLKLNPGDCDKAIPRFYYDSAAIECKAFNYTGCGGNVNNFATMELCETNCIRN